MNIAEINGNLVEEEDYDIFRRTIIDILYIFNKTFGTEIMRKYDLYIDNATQKSGYTPIITVILDKYISIKLGIDDFSRKEQITFQFSHELCHYVFYSIKGLDKEKAGEVEENICTAMSLVTINLLFPEKIEKWTSYVNNLKNTNYNKGAIIAEECNFDIDILKNRIFETCKEI